jgi:hypothetical protein
VEGINMTEKTKKEISRNEKNGNTINNLVKQLSEDFRYVKTRKQWIHWNDVYWENGDQKFSEYFDKEIENQGVEYDVDKMAIQKSLKEKLKLLKTDINSNLLLVTPDGIIDFRRFKENMRIKKAIEIDTKPDWLREPVEYKNRYITMCTQASYKWKTKKEPVLYKKVLLENLSDDSEMFDFYNIIDASILMGGLFYEYFYIYWGPGRNGKTILIDVKREMLGTYAGTLSPYVFRLKKTDSINDFYDVQQKRLVVIDELNKSTVIDASILKRVTGRNHFQSNKKIDSNDFTISFKTVFDSNHLPNVDRDESIGFWERVVIFPFRDVIQSEKRIKNLLNDMLNELDDIFTFIIDYYLPRYLMFITLPAENRQEKKLLDSTQVVSSVIDPLSSQETTGSVDTSKNKKKDIVVLKKTMVIPTNSKIALEYYLFSIDPAQHFVQSQCVQFEQNFMQFMNINRWGKRELYSFFIRYTREKLHWFMEKFKWGDETETFYFIDLHCSEKNFYQKWSNTVITPVFLMGLMYGLIYIFEQILVAITKLKKNTIR